MCSNTQELFESFPDTVLLVGNGKIENKRELIDSYECVIRFNDFKIHGYEKDVGTKVSAISFHSNNLQKSHVTYLYENYSKYVNEVPIFTLSSSSVNQEYNILVLQKGTKLLAVDPPIKNNPSVRLSSGGALALNLVLFFNKEVDMIGFDFMKTGHYYNQKIKHHMCHVRTNEEAILPKIKGITIL
jgi:hypothetical protein